jgi:hypothetical protein
MTLASLELEAVGKIKAPSACVSYQLISSMEHCGLRDCAVTCDERRRAGLPETGPSWAG